MAPPSASGSVENLPLRSALVGSAAAMAILRGNDLVIEYANPAHQDLLGWPFGRSLRDAVNNGINPAETPDNRQHAAIRQQANASLLTLAASALATGQAQIDPELAISADRFLTVTCSPIHPDGAESGAAASDGAAVSGVLMVAVDVSEHVRARKSVEGQNLRLAMLDQATTAVTSDLDLHHELRALARTVVPTLADACAIYLLDRKPATKGSVNKLIATRLVCVIDPARGMPAPAPEVRMHLAPRRPVTRAFLSGQAVLAEATEVNVRSWGEHWLDVLNPHSLLAIPFGNPDIVAVVSFYACPPRPPFQPSDLSLIREISARADVAVGHALRLQHTTEVALELQRGLLSDLPEVDGLEIVARYRPAGPGLEVGGDWYDVFALPFGGVGVAVGDIVGHDIYAVGAMGQLRSMVEALACQPGAEPGAVLTALNRLSTHLGVGELATVIYGRLDHAEPGEPATLTWANAGHPPPVLIRPGGDGRVLDGGLSPLLGLTYTSYQQTSVTLDPGDVLLIYTDGLIEGPDRPTTDPIDDLVAAATRNPGLELEELCDRLVAGAANRDDVALLAIRVRD